MKAATEKKPLHGGDIYRFQEETGCSLADIIDFSASINPLGPPAAALDAIREGFPFLRHYPDPEARRLTRALAEKYGIDPELILCGNGTTELIHLLARTIKPRAALIPAPTFAEYELAVRRSGGGEASPVRVERFVLTAENGFALRPDELIGALETAGKNNPVAMLFLCNPNNPTGGLLSRAGVLEIAAAAARHNCLLVVDEAYMDFVPANQSVIGQVADNDHLIVLKSLTKTYGIPGLRIGFGVFPRRLRHLLAGQREPWSVNQPAQLAAAVALTDREYETRTATEIAAGKTFLEGGFRSRGIAFFPSAANFYLLRDPQAREIYAGLKKKKILVRNCANFPGLDESYLRVAVRLETENIILLQEMGKLLRRQNSELRSQETGVRMRTANENA